MLLAVCICVYVYLFACLYCVACPCLAFCLDFLCVSADLLLSPAPLHIVCPRLRYPMCADNAATTYLYYNVTDVEDYAFRESSLIEAQVLPLPLNMSETLKVIGECWVQATGWNGPVSGVAITPTAFSCT